MIYNMICNIGFARTVTSIYAITFMHVLNRIQLNVMGRLKYVDSVLNYSQSDGSNEKDPVVSTDMEKAVLSLSWLFINKTVPGIFETVKNQMQKELQE